MVNPGMLINGRYEIIEIIGSGGMADVYKASDTRLNRMVAVKILKQEYSNDKSFITRFKNEAQSAAGLSHPNIVSVYDVGDDEGYHYIVMELVEGITLKKFIEKKGRLEVRESVGIAIQIAQGMEAAHDNHIIHRDIKPQNIIISRDGKVKVADFGIAKMVSSDTFTSNAIGSVHYLSPEQARGGYSDERSDIYSLGVTLYEMLTGQLPFGGETDITVALAHIQNQAKPAREIVPSIPYALDRVVQKCMQKHPENRYSSASDLIIDLKHSITNPDGDFVKIDDGSDVVSEPTKTFSDREVSQIKNQVKTQPAKAKSARPQNAADSKVLREELEELDTIDSKWEKAIMIISIVFVLAVCGGLIYAIVHFLGIGNLGDIATTPTPNPAASVTFTPSPEPTKTVTFKMPNLYGYTFDDAVRMMASYSKDVTVLEDTSEYSNDLDEGLVLKQYPIEGVDVLTNGTVRLTLSAGGEPISVPRVIGLTKDAAQSTLQTAGFLVSPVYEVSDAIESGMAIRTEPATGEMLKTGEKVVLFISSGAAVSYTEVPSLVGKTQEAAVKEIEEWGLVVGSVSEDYSDIFTEGYVINQSLEARKTVFKGDVIDITISMGPYPAGYVPTPTPEPLIDVPVSGTDDSVNWDGSKIDPVKEAGRQFYVVEFDTTGLVNPIEENGANWMEFKVNQDGRDYVVITDYTLSVENGVRDLISHSTFDGGISYRLYADYGEFTQLHEGVATIEAFIGSESLGVQVIYLNLETAW